MSTPASIIEKAILARSPDDAIEVQELIESAVGHRYQRPLGDRWNNQGILTASGASYDHKVLELVTNMQDAVIERMALRKYGSTASVPYSNPQEAAADLLRGLNREEKASQACVTIESSDTSKSKKAITLVMADRGCGMTPNQVPTTIFQVGAGHKDGVDWLQGTFGLGGATVYRNAKTAVLVTRRDPDLLSPGEEDRISVAVVQWERARTTTNAFYLVTSPWSAAGDVAPPFSAPAETYPRFEPGTHLSVIQYPTKGLARRSGDERSFDTVANTRLFEPVVPIKYRNLTVRPRTEYLEGLGKRLQDNPAPPDKQGDDTMPFNLGGPTYHLPVRFRLFSKPGEKGARRNFVAHDHAVAITSNGQVHSHWSPQEFRRLTKLNKLHDRILVVVETDRLPVELRTELFTADRTQMRDFPNAQRLQSEIVSFLNDWAALQEANSALIRESITGDKSGRPTIDIARKIARAINVKGFSVGGAGKGPGSKPPKPTPKEELHEDPTHFEGPSRVRAQTGTTRSVYYKLNAKDDFLPARAALKVTCSHPAVGDEEITVGSLRSGRVRVGMFIPHTDNTGEFKIEARIEPWLKASGGLGPGFEWQTTLELYSKSDDEESKPKKKRHGKGDSTKSKDGGLVALIWKKPEEEEDWDTVTVGSIEQVPGKDLAAEHADYKDLAKIEDEVPTILLNQSYPPLKKYIAARAHELSEKGQDENRERYAVGTGVALLRLDQDRKAIEKHRPTEDDVWNAAKEAAARGVLSVLPEFDKLAREYSD